ncbi:hypothetical protein ACF057_30590 [Rhodococcus erythropolis]
MDGAFAKAGAFDEGRNGEAAVASGFEVGGAGHCSCDVQECFEADASTGVGDELRADGVVFRGVRRSDTNLDPVLLPLPVSKTCVRALVKFKANLAVAAARCFAAP